MYPENANVALWFDKWNMELLSGTAHLQRGGRNPTEGAKNRARSLTVARYMKKKWKKSVFFLHFFWDTDKFWQFGIVILQQISKNSLFNYQN